MSSALTKSGVVSHDRAVHAVEGDLLGAGLHAGHVEHGLQRHAVPARAAHRAIAELAAGDARIEEAAAVAGALVDGDELDGVAASGCPSATASAACRPCP